MAKQALGRGLSALLGGDTPSFDPLSASDEIEVGLIDPNPDQPRTRFSEKTLDELAQSIAANGIVQPIVVRRNGQRFQIVAGERRWRAAQRAGLRTIPASIKIVTNDKLLELALIENIQRQELNPIEEATAYRKLIDTIGLTQEQVSERVGKERSLVATSLRLLKLPEEIKQLIEEGRLTAGHGRALLMAEERNIQLRVARRIIENSLSVRETERLIKRRDGAQRTGTSRTRTERSEDPNIKHAETRLMRKYGTNVKIVRNTDGKGGRIELEYYSMEDLDRIYRLMTES